MALDPYNADHRARGTILLANAPFGGDELYHELYVRQVGDEEANVRASGLRGLGLHGRPEDVGLILPQLEDEIPAVRLEAVRALQRIHNPEAIDALIISTRLPDPTEEAGRTGEPEPMIRGEAAFALGQYAEPRVVQPLIAALADRFLVVNESARRSLRTLTGQDFGFDRRAWLEWYRDTETPFAGRGEYVYPTFRRGKFWWEYLPFVPGPPNETPAPPVGLTPAAPVTSENVLPG